MQTQNNLLHSDQIKTRKEQIVKVMVNRTWKMVQQLRSSSSFLLLLKASGLPNGSRSAKRLYHEDISFPVICKCNQIYDNIFKTFGYQQKYLF